MFSYAAGRSAYPQVYSINKVKRDKKKDPPSRPPRQKKDVPSSAPALEGPPSPERIRAYTEQMKRTSLFGNGSRSNTITSTTPSFRSRESSSASNETTTLSRKSSSRSNSSNMPSTKADRPESVQIFGSIFSRSGRKARKDSTTGGNITGAPIEEESPKDNSESSESTRRHHISTPYNFQHVTHTRQDHIPDIDNRSRTELVSEFSAIRASQVPSKGELKGIRAQDLHFEDFSSESISPTNTEFDAPPAISPKSPRRQASLVKRSGAPARLHIARSQENLKSPPVRPPRSPASPPCPIDPPARTSSRTASILFDTFDPLATTTLERPQTTGGFRRPAPFSPPLVPPPAPSWSETDTYFSSRPLSHAVTTPGDEAWPLSASGTFGVELADVKEEDEPNSHLSETSQSTGDLRSSMSVPALRLRSIEQEVPQKIANQGEMNFEPESSVIAPQRTLLPSTFQGLRDSWEDDVDFCYENEIEANFDYQWEGSGSVEDSERTPPAASAPQLHLHLGEENQSAYHGRFRPSLLVPSSSDTPELSPMSDASLPLSDPRTPSQFLRPASHASSFKESHGFTLSPTLLIPTDFKAQMEGEALYDERFANTSNTTFPGLEGSIYSNSSYRSSGFSRQSARSSSSTRISTVNSRGSQDSGILVTRSASVGKAHRSISSVSSLPEMIPSALRNDQSSDSLASMNIPIPDIPDSAIASSEVFVAPGHRRNKSSSGEVGYRRGVNHFAPSVTTNDGLELKSLSPVAETFVESKEAPKEQADKVQPHGRKSSVPLAGIDNAKFKARARAATASAVGGKPRGTYALFPTIV